MFEHIINKNEKEFLRVAYPVEFKDVEYLVIQKKHFTNDEGEIEWRGGIFIKLESSEDADLVEEFVDTLVLALSQWCEQE